MENGLQVLMRGKKPTRRLLEYSLGRQGFPGLKHQEKEMQKSRRNQEILRNWPQWPVGVVDYWADVE